MLCEVHLTATFEDLNSFTESENSQSNDGDVVSKKTLFTDYKVAASSTGEVIALASNRSVVLCTSKWNSDIVDGPKIKYIPSGVITCKEEVTSIFCIPIKSQAKTHVCAEWTCIIVGFSTGWIRFYTDGGQELACSILQEEPVIEIKLHYPSSTSQGKISKPDYDDFYILYRTVICVLSGTSLIKLLKERNIELSKSNTFEINEDTGYISLDYKKYNFVNQEVINDACFLGQTLMASCNMFDHLVTASLVGGFHSSYKPSPPQNSLIITTGRKPFVGFHYTLEGGGNALLSDVALTVANKIKSSVTSTLPDWFGFGSKKPAPDEKTKEAVQDGGEKLNCRFGLCDLWRQGQSVVLSPDGTFSAVTDSLGRVFLIDNATGVALKLWKGYRNAQVGFVRVKEDIQKSRKRRDGNSKPHPRIGLFVVIYAPKKGVIDIFTVQHGRRVSSFHVSKSGLLLYIPNGQIGSYASSAVNNSQGQVLFLSEEGIKEFFIPFHCALAEDSSKISRDLHVLKKIKLLLKMEGTSSNAKFAEDIEKCAREFKTEEVRLQTLHLMVAHKNTTLEALKIVVNVFLEDLQKREELDVTQKKIKTYAESLNKLASFYEFLLAFNDIPPNYEAVVDSSKYSLTEELGISEKELDLTIKFINQIREIEGIKKQTTKVSFEEKKTSKFGQFLASFDFESFWKKLDTMEDKDGEQLWISLKSNTKEEKYCDLGEVFFKGAFSAVGCLHEWKIYLEACGLDPMDLAICLLSFWCGKTVPENFSPQVACFVEILKAICSLNDLNIVSAEYNMESPWWLRLRTWISGSPYTIQGLLAALGSRYVTILMEQEREFVLKQSAEKKPASEPGNTPALYNEWETISKDTCQWDILITQLQDVALLNAVLSLDFKDQKPSILPEIPFDFEYQCLTSIQLAGRGCVADLVAKWLVQFGFEPSVFVDKNDLEFQIVTTPKEEEDLAAKQDLVSELNKANEARGVAENTNLPLDYLTLLKTRFPYSLTTSSLLSNISLEYISYWLKSPNELKYLESAFHCIEVIPSNTLKYGVSYVSWKIYLEQKFENLAKMINGIGKVPRDKLCEQEIGLKSSQVSEMIRLVGEYLKVILNTEVQEKWDLDISREAIWQNSTISRASDLVSVVLAQPTVNPDMVVLQLQLSASLLIISGLNVKFPKVLTSLFDNLERSSFNLTKNSQLTSYGHNPKLVESRKRFLLKAITAAVQLIELVKNDAPTEDSPAEITWRNVDEYRKWIQISFDLAREWNISSDDLRRHQICELYSSGLDRLAEEIIPPVSESSVLASQLLVLAGKRLKCIIQESLNSREILATLSLNLANWLQSLDTEGIRYQSGNLDDIGVIMRYVGKSLDENPSVQSLALAIIESLSFLKNKNS